MNFPLNTSQTTNQVDCHFKPKMMLTCTISNKNDIIYRSYVPYAPWSWHICLHLPYIPTNIVGNYVPYMEPMAIAHHYDHSHPPNQKTCVCLGGTSPGGFLLLMLLSQLTFHNAHLLQDLVELSKVSVEQLKNHISSIYGIYMHLHVQEIWAANW